MDVVAEKRAGKVWRPLPHTKVESGEQPSLPPFRISSGGQGQSFWTKRVDSLPSFCTSFKPIRNDTKPTLYSYAEAKDYNIEAPIVAVAGGLNDRQSPPQQLPKRLVLLYLSLPASVGRRALIPCLSPLIGVEGSPLRRRRGWYEAVHYPSLLRFSGIAELLSGVMS